MTKTRIILGITSLLLGCNNIDKQREPTEAIGAKKELTQTPLKQSIARGAVIYTDFCLQCHRTNGKGVAKNFPPLAGSNWLTDKRTESIKSIKFGLKGEIEVNGQTYNGIMAPLGLSDKEVADVMNYTMNSWGNTQKEMVTEQEVATVKK